MREGTEKQARVTALLFALAGTALLVAAVLGREGSLFMSAVKLVGAFLFLLLAYQTYPRASRGERL